MDQFQHFNPYTNNFETTEPIEYANKSGIKELNEGPIEEDSFVKFESGAVRDIRPGKGRCDLLPLHPVSDLIGDPYINLIAQFIEKKDRLILYECLDKYFNNVYGDIYTGILELSIHFEEGAKKYGEHNWEEGIPVHSFIDSAVRHRLKMLRGDEDERHDRAFAWNVLCAIWTCEYKPELIDINYQPKKEDLCDHQPLILDPEYLKWRK